MLRQRFIQTSNRLPYPRVSAFCRRQTFSARVRDAPKDYDEVSPRNYDDLVTYDKIGGTQSITGFVKQDHRAIEEYYSRIINSSDSDEQTRFQNQFVWALARHSIGEELVLYPAIEEYVEGGKAIADKDREQHQTLKHQLYEFQNLKPEDPRFTTTLTALFKDLKEHISEEEEHDLPALEASVEDTHSNKLARSFDRTKMFVPTRSHPNSPNKPPYETAVGLLAAPLDKLRDMFSKFPKS